MPDARSAEAACCMRTQYAQPATAQPCSHVRATCPALPRLSPAGRLTSVSRQSIGTGQAPPHRNRMASVGNRKGGCHARGQNPRSYRRARTKACGITSLTTFRLLYSGCLRYLAPHHIQTYTKPVNMQAVMSKSFVGQSLRAAVPTAGQVWIPEKVLLA